MAQVAMDMQDEWLRRLRAWAKANDSVRQLWLFGSRATGRSRPDSDVDLALALMPPKGKHDWALGNYFALESKWKQQLEEIVGCHVSLQPLVPDSDLVEIVRASGVLLVEPRTETITGLMLTLTRAAVASLQLPRCRSSAEAKQRQAEGQAKGREARKAGTAPIGAQQAKRAADDAAKAFGTSPRNVQREARPRSEIPE
jgi:predicted nucleotidyltransferase